MHFKFIALTLLLAFSSNYIVADAWPEKECNQLSGYVGLLSAASAGSLEEATEAKMIIMIDWLMKSLWRLICCLSKLQTLVKFIQHFAIKKESQITPFIVFQ